MNELRKITKEELREILTDHKNWLVSNGKVGINADLSKTYLARNNLYGTNLNGADMHGAFLYNANLSRADLGRANLSGADLRSAFLHSINLSCANLVIADLSKADLYEVDMINADLRGANMCSANLSDANLSDANLSFTNLSNANLSGANLSDANLSGADLSDANLSGANLGSTSLKDTNLSYANLNDAHFGYTDLTNIDLSSTKNLRNAKHYGPSSIGIDTIYKSKGKIPKEFLRGAGVPDNFIEYMDLLVYKTIDYYSCFISYSHKDEEFVKRLHTDLLANRIRSWLDQEDLKIGDKTRQIIHESIRVHDKLLLILSEESINSSWVEDEVNTAMSKERRSNTTSLFPIRIDNSIMETEKAWAETIRNDRHIGDFANWKNHDDYKQAFARLLRDLKL